MTDPQRVRAVLDNRHAVLEHLVDSPARKPEIVSALDISRSTVDRAIRDLMEIECVRGSNGTYHSTLVGRLALFEYDRYRTRITSLQQATGFLNGLPNDADLDPVVLDDASITLAEPHAPDHALEQSIDLFREATSLKGLAPVVLAAYPDLIADRLARSALTVEIVAEDEVIATLPELQSSQAESLLDQDELTLYSAETSLPFALWLMDTPTGTHAGITAYNAGGVTGVLITDSDPAIEWASNQYRQYRDQAQQIPLSNV